MSRKALPLAAVLVSLIMAAPVAAADMLASVKARGTLLCGVNQDLAGFSTRNDAGVWSGFDVDFCRAVAAAIFSDAGKVDFVPLSTSDRFDALKSGKIDMLARNSTWTLSRELDYDISFAAVTYFDGQGFMVPRTKAVTSALELGGSKVCVQKDTTSQRNQADYFTANSMTFEAILTASAAESLERYKKGECSVMTSDVSQLYSERLTLADAAEHIILPDIISKEPLAPAVRADDPKWRGLVQWVHFAMLSAEELGVSQRTLDQALGSARPSVRRLLGKEGDLGSHMGLSNDWAASIVRLVGNYGEVYDRNLGVGSRLAIPRGVNQLWSLGGIQYSPPVE
jgi:general L-amino acid transport system substrate-binding protein